MPRLVRAVLIWTALFGAVILSPLLPWFWWNVLVISLMSFAGVMFLIALEGMRSTRLGKRPWMERVWFYRPSWFWYGPSTLIPFHSGSDEWDWHTIVLGWTVTGRVIIATRQCPQTGKCAPDPDDPHEVNVWPADPYPDHDFEDNPYPRLAYYRSLPQYQRKEE